MGKKFMLLESTDFKDFNKSLNVKYEDLPIISLEKGTIVEYSLNQYKAHQIWYGDALLQAWGDTCKKKGRYPVELLKLFKPNRETNLKLLLGQ